MNQVTNVDLLVQTYGLKTGREFTYKPGSGEVRFKSTFITLEEMAELIKVVEGFELLMCFSGDVSIYVPMDPDDEEPEHVPEEPEDEPPIEEPPEEEPEDDEIAQAVDPEQEETPEIVEEEKLPEDVVEEEKPPEELIPA